ncbi:MAG: CHASE2 domain-containing protein [Deltaproteobacteria bacterium]|nr:CHASE2 domain-containing protein [Deltaproteobacteria bacterium]
MKKWIPIIISMVISMIFALTHVTIETGLFQEGWFSQTGPLRTLDRSMLNFKFRSHAQDTLPTPQVVIAGVDESSLDEFGRWPWDRNVIADLINQLTRGGAKVIAFDMAFTDEDRNAHYQELKRIQELFEASDLLPVSSDMKNIDAGLAQLAKNQTALQTSINAIKLDIAKAPGPIRAQLKQTLQALVDIERTTKSALAGSMESLADVKKHSGEFYDVLGDEITAVSPDLALAKAIANSPQTILGYICYFERRHITGVEESDIPIQLARLKPSAIAQVFESTELQVGDNVVFSSEPSQDIDMQELLPGGEILAAQAPLEILAEASKNFGYFNAIPDPDGPLRQLPLFFKYNNELYPALALKAASLFFDYTIQPLKGEILPNTLSGAEFGGDRPVPTTDRGMQLINYYKDPEAYFPLFSVKDIINGRLDASSFKDKVVFVGMTARGGFDLRPNPFSPSSPGVYIHAMATQNMIDSRYLERWTGIALVEALGYLLLGLIFALILPRLSPFMGLVATLFTALALYIFDTALVFPSGHWMLMVFPTMQLLFLYLGITIYGYFTEGKEKRQIKNAFQFYLSKSVVDEVLDDPSKLSLGGEKRVCTVLFSDIRGFTTISERLAPEKLTALLNEYLTPMTNIVFKHEGTLDKYMGDAIMAIFGAPMAHPDHAARSCLTALEMMEKLRELHPRWHEQGLPELDIGIGVNTGPMSVGNMGSKVRFDYTVMGDNVNLGSRLEGINKQYGTNIMISEYTYNYAKDRIFARELDSVRVKGKREPVKIYELLGSGTPDDGNRQLMDNFHEALGLYRQQKWSDAIKLFNHVRTLKADDFTSGVYISRCEAMRAQPPGPDWDGVFTMTTK